MNKYNAKKVTYDGIVFDSKKEYNRYIILKQKEKDGIISNLNVHIPVTIINKNDKFRKCVYVVDFKYMYNNDFIYEDVKPSKSMITDVFKLKQKLMYDKYGIYVNVILDVNEFEPEVGNICKPLVYIKGFDLYNTDNKTQQCNDLIKINKI